MDVYLETERIALRRFGEADLDRLVDLNADPSVLRYINGSRPIRRAEIERDFLPAYLAYHERGARYGFWAAVEKASGAFLGWFHFRPSPGAPDDEPELGYRLRRSAWGKGYGTEGSRALIRKGFSELGVARVVAYTYGDNIASRRVMEKAGMRLVRTFRLTPEQLKEELGVTDPELFPGDDVEYAITRAEWEAQGR